MNSNPKIPYSKTAPVRPGAHWWKRCHREPQREAVLVDVRYAKGGVLVDKPSGLPPYKVGGVWSPRLVPERSGQ